MKLIRTKNEFISITQEQFDRIISIEQLDEFKNNKERWNSLDDLPGEIWREIKDTNKRFSVSIYGRVKQNNVTILFNNSNRNPYYKHLNEKIINSYCNQQTLYPTVDLLGKHLFVHRLVAETFILNDDPENKNVVDHINTIRDCAHIFNLKICTTKENMANPLTRKKSSQTKRNMKKFKVEVPIDASTEDLIDDYISLENIFSPRMFSLIDFKNEEWKYNKDYDIFVSNFGRLKKYSERFKKMYIIKQTFNNSGYLTTKYKKFSHCLVMETFVGPMPNEKECIDHINTLRFDNRITNLRYVTRKENSANELTVEKQRNISTGKTTVSVLLYDAISGEFIKEYSSIKETTKELNINNDSVIINAINNRSVICGKYLIIYKRKNGKIDSKIEPTDRNMFKPISKYDLDGNYISTYDSVYDIEETKTTIKRHQIIKCCTGEVKSSFGYMWRFSDETTNNIQMYRRNNIKFINQYDGTTGEYIKTFKSGKEASEELGIWDSIITEACDNHKICHGFAFRFVDDFNQTENLSEYKGFTETALHKFKEYDNLPINKYSYEGKYIETLNNIYDCSDYLRHRILLCCLGKMNVYSGFLWKFAKDADGKEDIEPYVHKHIGEFMKINMYDIYGHYLKTFENTNDAIENAEFKVPYSQLIECCHGKIDTLKGHFFRYTYNDNTLDLWDSGLYYINEKNDIYKKSQFNNENAVKYSKKAIIIYDALTGFLVKRYYSASICAKELGCDRNVLRHMSFINNKYIVVLATLDDKLDLRIDVPKQKIVSIRPINKYTISGKYICTYDNIDEASATDKSYRQNILNACNRKTLQFNGFQWRWSYNNYDDIPSVEERCKNQNTKNNKCVVMYDLEMNKIQRFESLKEASEKVGIESFNIIDCCNNRRKTVKCPDGRYIFKYEYINRDNE